MSTKGDEPRRGRPRSEAPRKAVLEAMAEMVRASTPYDLLTIEGLASASGVAKTTIYRRWDSKSDIVLDAVLSGALRLVPPDVEDTGDLRADLMDWIHAMREQMYRPSHVNLARILLMAGLETPWDSASLRNVAWEAEHLIRRLRDAAEQGEIAADQDFSVAAAALSHTFAISLASGEQPTEQWCEDLVDLVLGGLKKP